MCVSTYAHTYSTHYHKQFVSILLSIVYLELEKRLKNRADREVLVEKHILPGKGVSKL